MPFSVNPKTCLVVSYGPVPTSEYQTVEGGGMRAWGLAKGLLDNGVDVTVAVNNSFPQKLESYEDVNLVNWSPDTHFAELINSYDAVIVSYSMGSDAVFIADNISDDVLLILDVYVPIYVEVSARESNDVANEFKHYMADIQRFNHVLKRGDYFLCANDTQKVFYTGILGSLGIINPRSYRHDRLLIVPFGIHNTSVKPRINPYKNLGIGKDEKVILWFGGIYPWFRVEEYLDAVLSLTKAHKDMKFVIVGGKNPFNPNPDFFRQYDKALAFAAEHKLINKNMFFVDWVDFDDRINWYSYADFVISLNQPGEENRFSWRTRVMDYVWGELVTLTNGGDPLSEDLLENNAAIRLDRLNASELVSKVENIYKDKKFLPSIKSNLQRQKPRFYWSRITVKVSDVIKSSDFPYKDEKAFKSTEGITNNTHTLLTENESRENSKVKKVIRMLPKTISYARRKGLKRTARMAAGILRNQAKKQAKKVGRQYIFITHPLDNTGAPLVMMQIVDEVREKYGSGSIKVIASYTSPNNVKTLAEKRINLHKAAVMGLRLTGLQLALNKDDFVLLNTVAVHHNYRDYVFNSLVSGRLSRAYWFIHEDLAQLNVVAKELATKEYVGKIHELIKSEKLTILVPSKRVKQDYDQLYGVNSVLSVPLHVDIPDKFLAKRTVKDYSKLNFLLSGTPTDGRKGQLIALSAFQRFIDTYYNKDPSKYRDFSVHFVSIAEDYVSTQIKTIGNVVLGKKLHLYPSLPRDEALEITKKCNAVICCSLNETFALYVAEGMMMGHVVLRNSSAGVDEQLVDGKNGYYIDSDDINQFAEVLERLLNKESSSNEALYKMGEKSHSIAKEYSKSKYLEFLS